MVYSELWVDLFNPHKIQIYKDKEVIDTIFVESMNVQSVKKTQLIDYSCSPFNLKMSGMENEYVSVGCNLEKIGKMGSETPSLEVSFSTTNFSMKNGASAPYKIILKNNDTAQFTLVNNKGETKEVSISATIPKRLHRLKTAVGLGRMCTIVMLKIFQSLSR